MQIVKTIVILFNFAFIHTDVESISSVEGVDAEWYKRTTYCISSRNICCAQETGNYKQRSV